MVSTAASAVYAEPGYLLYRRETARVAQPFDPVARTLSGTPVTIQDNIGFNPISYQVLLSASADGVLLSLPATRASQLVWFDRQGRRIGVAAPHGHYSALCLTNDDSRVVYDMADPETANNQKYGYACPSHYDLRPGGEFKTIATDAMKARGAPDTIIVGSVIESDPPRKLVQIWHPIWDPGSAAEAPTTLTYEIKQQPGGFCRLTVINDVTGAPITATTVSGEHEQAGGGWAWVLSDLKTMLETGKGMGAQD